MNKPTYLFLTLLPLLLVGCYNHNVHLVDFTSIDGGEGTFHVMSQQTTDTHARFLHQYECCGAAVDGLGKWYICH